MTLDDLNNFLKQQLPGYENKLFGLNRENHIGLAEKPQYKFDTPHGYWDATWDQLPELEWNRDRMQFADAIEEAIASAQYVVDIATMKTPSGAFLDKIRNGIAKLTQRKDEGVTVQVRIVVGLIGIDSRYPTEAILREWLPHFGSGQRVKVYIGAINFAAKSWNHAKFVAVDGQRLITGGHNLWADDYLSRRPIFDLSLRVDGPIAAGAHEFASQMWAFIHRHNHQGGTYSYLLDTKTRKITPEAYAGNLPMQGEAAGTLPVLWVANPGLGLVETTRSAGLEAMCEAIRRAKHFRLCQQDLGAYGFLPVLAEGDQPATYSADGSDFPVPSPDAAMQDSFIPVKLQHGVEAIAYYVKSGAAPIYFSKPFMEALVNLMMPSDTKLDIVLTNLDAKTVTGVPYSNGVNPWYVARLLCLMMWARGVNRTHAKDKLMKQMVLGTVATSPTERGSKWGNGVPMGNHAKFWMADNNIFYVGSENCYPTPGFKRLRWFDGLLHEFGVIVESQTVAQTLLLNDYFNYMLKYSHKVNISDIDRDTAATA